MDAGMLEQVLTHIHNWFPHGETAVRGCAIESGQLPASVNVPEGVWYRIQGSLLNDGLHVGGSGDLMDETFDGTITVCAIPNALLDVVEEIEDWKDSYKTARKKVVSSPYSSESFDGYSYTYKDPTAGSSASGGLTGWQAAFAADLNPWRKMH